MTVESGTKFTQVPTEILTDARLSAPSRLLYSILKSYAWQTDNSFPGQKTLADQLGCSDRMVRTYLQELENCGLVTVEQRGKMTTNKYFLTDKINSDWNPTSASDRKYTSTHKPSDRKPVSAMSGSTVPVMTGSTLPTNNTHGNNTQYKNTTPLPPKSKPAEKPLVVVDEKAEMRKKLKTLFPPREQMAISGATNSRLHEVTDKYPLDWVQAAFLITADAGGGLAYLVKVLEHWQIHGLKCECHNPQAAQPVTQRNGKPIPFEQVKKPFNPDDYKQTPAELDYITQKRARDRAFEEADKAARLAAKAKLTTTQPEPLRLQA